MLSTLDERLIDQIRLKNRQALEHLYARYESLLFRYALHLNNHPATAEAALTDLFCHVWQQRLNFEPHKETRSRDSYAFVRTNHASDERRNIRLKYF